MGTAVKVCVFKRERAEKVHGGWWITATCALYVCEGKRKEEVNTQVDRDNNKGKLQRTHTCMGVRNETGNKEEDRNTK